MPASERPVVYSWIPKGAGKGGQFSNATSHDSDSDFLYIAKNVIVDGGRWLPKPDDTLIYNFGSFGSGYKIDSLLVFNSYGATTSRDYLIASAYNITSQYQTFLTYDTTNGAVSYASNYFTASGSGAEYPVTFQSVKNKIYASCGYTAKVATPASGPQIIYDTTGTGGVLTAINWGLPTPTTNLQITPTSYQQGTGTVTAGDARITVLSFDPRVNLAAGMPFYIETTPGSGQFSQYTIASCDSVSQLTLTSIPTDTAGAGRKVQGNYGSLSWGNITPLFQSGTATTNATTTLASVSFDPTINCKAGYTCLVETGAGTNIWDRYVIQSVSTSPNTITLTGATTENYAGARIRVDLTPQSSPSTADNSYLYAIAYYDSARGHVGDIGPKFVVDFGPPFNNRVDLVVSNICDYSKTPDYRYSSGLNWTNISNIILYRSGATTSDLYPMVILPLAGAGASYVQSYTDRQADDSQFTSGQVAPYAAAQAPGKHAPPPIDLNYATYWQGRFFGSSTSNPGILYWSSLFSEIGFYGVPEECWNPVNNLSIPSSDGIITGIKVVGPNLLITTQNNVYQVTYNSVANGPLFALSRVSAKGRGTAQFATATLPGEDSQSGDVLLHFGNDRRFYMLFGAGGDMPISYPIQDQFNSISAYSSSSNVAVGVSHNPHATYIPVMAATASSYMYDLDRKMWFQLSNFYTSTTEGLFNGSLYTFMGDNSNKVYTFMTATTTAGTLPRLMSQPLVPPGVKRRDECRLQAIIVYGSGWTLTPTSMQVALDESGVFTSLVNITSSPDPRMAVYLDAPDAMLFVPQGSTMSGRIFQWTFGAYATSSSAYISEVMCLWSVSSDEASSGGVI